MGSTVYISESIHAASCSTACSFCDNLWLRYPEVKHIILQQVETHKIARPCVNEH